MRRNSHLQERRSRSERTAHACSNATLEAFRALRLPCHDGGGNGLFALQHDPDAACTACGSRYWPVRPCGRRYPAPSTLSAWRPPRGDRSQCHDRARTQVRGRRSTTRVRVHQEIAAIMIAAMWVSSAQRLRSARSPHSARLLREVARMQVVHGAAGYIRAARRAATPSMCRALLPRQAKDRQMPGHQ